MIGRECSQERDQEFWNRVTWHMQFMDFINITVQYDEIAKYRKRLIYPFVISIQSADIECVHKDQSNAENRLELLNEMKVWGKFFTLLVLLVHVEESVGTNERNVNKSPFSPKTAKIPLFSKSRCNN